MNRRVDRVNSMLREQISQVLSGELSDPRLSSMVSVIRVSCARDLGTAKVMVSVLGTPEEKRATLAGLRSASGYVRRSLIGRTSLRKVPAVEFIVDDSIERGAEVLKLIEEVAPEPEDDVGTPS